LSLERDAAAVALDIHFEDGGVVDKPVDGGERHGGIGEDPIPLTERLICSNQRDRRS
jgi:hypothetical protein